MEINTQQLEALLHTQEQQTQLPRKNTSQASGFDSMLAEQLAESSAVPQRLADPALTGAALFGQMIESGSRIENDANMAVMQAAMDQASGTLDLWDNYTRALSSPATASLRDAYSLLEGIDTQLSALRSSPAMGKSATFDGIVNELEILATAEKFKFNRGDYGI